MAEFSQEDREAIARATGWTLSERGNLLTPSETHPNCMRLMEPWRHKGHAMDALEAWQALDSTNRDVDVVLHGKSVTVSVFVNADEPVTDDVNAADLPTAACLALIEADRMARDHG